MIPISLLEFHQGIFPLGGGGGGGGLTDHAVLHFSIGGGIRGGYIEGAQKR